MVRSDPESDIHKVNKVMILQSQLNFLAIDLAEFGHAAPKQRAAM